MVRCGECTTGSALGVRRRSLAKAASQATPSAGLDGEQELGGTTTRPRERAVPALGQQPRRWLGPTERDTVALGGLGRRARAPWYVRSRTVSGTSSAPGKQPRLWLGPTERDIVALRGTRTRTTTGDP